ncbi:hypothetical protein PO909_029459 [Leuciscus waleckii]
MRPFPGGTLPPERRVFNYRLSRARLVEENAFGIFSSQWRMYRHLIEVHPEVAEKCVKVTCVLHNFMRYSEGREAPAVRGAGHAGEEPLPGLGQVAANNSSREALQVVSLVPGCQVRNMHMYLSLNSESLTFSKLQVFHVCIQGKIIFLFFNK